VSNRARNENQYDNRQISGDGICRINCRSNCMHTHNNSGLFNDEAFSASFFGFFFFTRPVAGGLAPRL